MLRRGSAIEFLPDRALLFCEQTQQIHELNSSGAVLACRLQTGATVAELRAELTRFGLTAYDADGWILAFLTEAAQLELLAAGHRQTAPTHRQQISIGALNLSLHYSSYELFRLIGAAYSHLVTTSSVVDCEYHLSAAGDFVFISRNGGPAAVVHRAMAAVRFKGMILERVLAAPYYLAALHAAFLVRNNRGLLLLGSPGAGKSTLTLALSTLGYRYGSDDVALVGSDGIVGGIPLAPAVKQGAWELAESNRVAMSDLPGHLRPDGQRVRFVRLSREVLASPCCVDTIVRLRRQASRRPALNAIPATEALAELLRESRSTSGKCSAEIMRALAAVVKGARCFDLVYSEAAEAAAHLRDIDGDA